MFQNKTIQKYKVEIVSFRNWFVEYIWNNQMKVD